MSAATSRLPPPAPRKLSTTWRTLAAGVGISSHTTVSMLRIEEHRARALVKQACTALQRRRISMQHPLARKRARSLAEQWRHLSRVSRNARARTKRALLISSITNKWKGRANININTDVKKVVQWLFIKKQPNPNMTPRISNSITAAPEA